jgi:hypothetical protein
LTVALAVEIESRTLPRVEADLVAAGFFADEWPVRGIAGLADWRLCGLISQMLEQGVCRGELGEAILAPTGGRLRVPRVLLLGLGERSAFRKRQLLLVKSLTTDLVRRAQLLGVHTLALAAPGVAPFDFPRHVSAVLGGVLEALQGATLGLRLRLMLPVTEVGRVGRALTTTALEVPQGVSLELILPSPSLNPVRPPGPERLHRLPKTSSISHRY